jgi:uncharacterized protein YbjT (DUF2867 family)
MKIVVIGGTGLIGSKVVANLKQKGHEVLAAAPNTGINTITGEGLKEAMAGTQGVIDLANSPSFEDKAVLKFFETSGRNLLAAEAAAGGVRHHVALSIVGIDRSDNGYFRAKLAQEQLIKSSGTPYSMIRLTQFLEFLRGIVASGADGNVVRISPGLFQPIAADDVGAIVADVALAAPRNGIVEIAGPERAPFNEFVARYLKAIGDPRKVVSDPQGPILRRPGRGALAGVVGRSTPTTGPESRSVEAVGKKIIADAEISFGAKPNIITAGPNTFFAGSRSDAFFFDFDGIKNLFDISGKRNFTEPHLGGKSPVTGVDSNTEANVCSTANELPTSEINPRPEMHIWGRCSVRRDGKLLHVDRACHPSVSSFFNTDDTKEEYNASEPVNDRKRWLEQFIHLMGHTGNYTREEAVAAIDKEGTLPDVLSFDPSKPAKYPNGRVFTDDVIEYRLAFLDEK